MNGFDDYDRCLKKLNPKTVGISVVRPNKQTALDLAERAHKAGSTVILGGPDPTTDPESYLSEPYIDFVVHHEGELTLSELLDNLIRHPGNENQTANMPGLAYRAEDGTVNINPHRPYILDLDQLPPPARDLVDLEQYLDLWRAHNGYASLTISISRGCPYGCNWCQDSVHGPEHRLRSPESVVSEVKEIMDYYNIDRLRLVDDVDGIDKAWLEEWAECAESQGVIVPFEALNDLTRQDIPMLDVRDTL